MQLALVRFVLALRTIYFLMIIGRYEKHKEVREQKNFTKQQQDVILKI